MSEPSFDTDSASIVTLPQIRQILNFSPWRFKNECFKANVLKRLKVLKSLASNEEKDVIEDLMEDVFYLEQRC